MRLFFILWSIVNQPCLATEAAVRRHGKKTKSGIRERSGARALYDEETNSSTGNTSITSNETRLTGGDHPKIELGNQGLNLSTDQSMNDGQVGFPSDRSVVLMNSEVELSREGDSTTVLEDARLEGMKAFHQDMGGKFTKMIVDRSMNKNKKIETCEAIAAIQTCEQCLEKNDQSQGCFIQACVGPLEQTATKLREDVVQGDKTLGEVEAEAEEVQKKTKAAKGSKGNKEKGAKNTAATEERMLNENGDKLKENGKVKMTMKRDKNSLVKVVHLMAMVKEFLPNVNGENKKRTDAALKHVKKVMEDISKKAEFQSKKACKKTLYKPLCSRVYKVLDEGNAATDAVFHLHCKGEVFGRQKTSLFEISKEGELDDTMELTLDAMKEHSGALGKCPQHLSDALSSHLKNVSFPPDHGGTFEEVFRHSRAIATKLEKVDSSSAAALKARGFVEGVGDAALQWHCALPSVDGIPQSIRDQRCSSHLAGISFAEQSFTGSQSEQGLRRLIDVLQQFDLRGNETSEPYMQQPMPMQRPMQQPMYPQQGPMMMQPSPRLQRRMFELEKKFEKEKEKNNRSSLTKNVLGSITAFVVGGILLGAVIAACATTFGLGCGVMGVALVTIASILLLVGMIIALFAAMAYTRM